MKILIISLLAILLIPFPGYTYTPPSGTPLGDQVHPRLYFIPEGSSYNNFGIKISEIRDKAANNAVYRAYLQDLIDEMDRVYPDKVDDIIYGKLESSMRIMNYSFLYLLDLTGTPVNGITSNHSTAEYGARAKEIAFHLADHMACYEAYQITPAAGDVCGSINDADNNWLDYKQYHYGDDYWNGSAGLSIAIVNDWCHDLFTDSERRRLFDALIANYNRQRDSPVFDSYTAWADHRFYGSTLPVSFGVVGFYGDDFDDASENYDTAIATQMDAFNNYFLKAMTDTHEGSCRASRIMQGNNYDLAALLELARILPAWSSAMNTNYFTKLNWLKGEAERLVYTTFPMPDGGKYGVFPFNDSGYDDLWHDWSNGKNNIIWNPLKYGYAKGGEQDKADLLSWFQYSSGWIGGSDNYNDNNIRWRNLLVKILFNAGPGFLESATNKSPETLNLPLAKMFGTGTFIMRSGFNSTDDTVIAFQAKTALTNYGGHGHMGDYGAFMIHKYGDHTLTRNLGKGFIVNSGDKSSTRAGMFYNTMAAYKSGEDSTNGYNLATLKASGRVTTGWTAIDPNDNIYFKGGANYIGDSVSELNNSVFDYVDYDYSDSWDDTKVTYAEREFVYLRSAGGSQDEYVITFDRMTTSSPSYEKRWLLQIPFDMTLLDGSNNTVTMTAEVHPDDPDGGTHRWVANTTINNKILSVNTFDRGTSPDSHAKMLVRPIWPANTKIVKRGANNGSGLWLDASGKTVAVKTAMNDSYKNYAGMFTAEIWPATPSSNYDYMLNVIQFGDSNAQWNMTDMAAIDSSVGHMAGVHIMDNTQNKIILFSSSENSKVAGSNVSYSAGLTTSTTQHLLFGMQPNTVYTINFNGDNYVITSGATGVISFVTSDVPIPRIQGISIREF